MSNTEVSRQIIADLGFVDNSDTYARKVVNNLFKAWVGRDATEDELKRFSPMMEGTNPDRRGLRDAIIAEYGSSPSEETANELVERWFQKIHNRNPTPKEKQEFSRKLQDGTPLAQVRREIKDSDGGDGSNGGNGSGTSGDGGGEGSTGTKVFSFTPSKSGSISFETAGMRHQDTPNSPDPNGPAGSRF